MKEFPWLTLFKLIVYDFDFFHQVFTVAFFENLAQMEQEYLKCTKLPLPPLYQQIMKHYVVSLIQSVNKSNITTIAKMVKLGAFLQTISKNNFRHIGDISFGLVTLVTSVIDYCNQYADGLNTLWPSQLSSVFLLQKVIKKGKLEDTQITYHECFVQYNDSLNLVTKDTQQFLTLI